MRRFVPYVMVIALVVVVIAVATSTDVFAKGKPGGGDECPRNIMCPDYWDPVICDDGQIYSNACYAYRACATGCESLGQGPIPLVKE